MQDDDAISAIGMIVSGALIVLLIALAGFYWVKPLAIHCALASAIFSYATNAARVLEADGAEVLCFVLSTFAVCAGIVVLIFG